MWYTYKIYEIERKLRTTVRLGLKNKEVTERQIKYGKNIIQEGKKENIFIKFIKQFNDFMIIILIIVLFLFILTLFDRDKIVYQKVEDVYHKKKKMFSIRK